jgi:hypothetical protein
MDVVEGGLDVILARLSAKFSDRMDGGTVLFSEATAKRLGFPTKCPVKKNALTHPVLDAPRNVGWEVKKLSPWMTFHRKRFDCPSVHVGVLPWLDKRTFCFIDEPDMDAIVMTERIRMFSSLMGVAFRMTPGVTACTALMRSWGGVKPFWKPSWTGVTPAEFTRESRYRWTGDTPKGTVYEHGWDIRQQYLAAASVSSVSLNALIHTGRKAFDYSPGYWLITVPAWNQPKCPHPAGNYQGGEQAWVTTPTVAYLHELAGRFGVVTEPVIHDSWTGSGSHRLFRTWAERIRDGITWATEQGNPCVTTALKQSYKQAFGLFQTPTGFLQRPDWADIIAANARNNMHRKIWKEGNRENGTWPTRIVYDCVYYPSNHEEPIPPRMFCEDYQDGNPVLLALMGKFKYERTVKAGEPLTGEDDQEAGRE